MRHRQNQRRRTRGIHRHRGPLEPQGVGDPAGENTRGTSRGLVAVHDVEALIALTVVRADRPYVHTSETVAQTVRPNARPLERLPGDLQYHALLWVHRMRLTGRDPEKACIKLIDLA